MPCAKLVIVITVAIIFFTTRTKADLNLLEGCFVMGLTGIKEGVEICIGNDIQTASVHLKPGYWRHTNVTTAVLKCPLTGACGGERSFAGDDSCSEGYEGPLCGICSGGYYSTNNECAKCDQITISLQIICSVLLLLGIGSLWWYLSEVEQVRGKIILTTTQIVMSASEVFSVAMPPLFAKLSKGVSFLFLDFNSITGCTAKFDYFEILLAMTIPPLGIILAVSILCSLEYFIRCHILQSLPTREVPQRLFEYVRVALLITFLVLPLVATTIVHAFQCTDVDPNLEDNMDNEYMVADLNISCSSDYYRYKVLPYAVLMFLLYPVGIPAMYGYMLYTCREELKNRFMEDREVNSEERTAISTNSDLSEEWNNGKMSPLAHCTDFLWRDYKPKYWYWELIETTRRLSLTALLSVLFPGSIGQIIIGLTVTTLYIKLYSIHSPYLEREDNIFAELAQFQILFVNFAVLAVTSDTWGNVVEISLAICLLLPFVVLLCTLIKPLFQNRLLDLPEINEDFGVQDFAGYEIFVGDSSIKKTTTNECFTESEC